MNLPDLQKYVFGVMESKGFHSDRSNSRDDVIVRLALVHTEISEAIQEVKRHWIDQGSPELRHAVGLELADAMIRLLDLCGCLGMDSESLIFEKMKVNESRPHRYGTPDGK